MPNPPQSLTRLVVFTSNPNFSVRAGIVRLLEAFEGAEILVLVHAPRRRPARLLRNQFLNLRRHGVAWIPYQGAEIVTLASLKLSRTRPRTKPGLVGVRYRRETLEAMDRVRFAQFASINSAEARQTVRDFGPDLGISLAAPILKEDLFAIPTLGTINLHKGKLPQYRGMPPAFWEIQDGRDEVGCTVHVMHARLDAGPILVESSLPIAAYSTAGGMRVGLDELGNRLLIEAVTQLRDGSASPRPQSADGARTNSRPRLTLEWRTAREAARREGTVSARQSVKDAVFRAYSAAQSTGRALRVSGRAPTAVVLLYHRVNDVLRDNVTIGIEKFGRQIAYLADHWNVVSLRDLVTGEVQYTPGRPLLCVTFDDGYKDNYDFAAPILTGHGVPATFFVSTDKITNQTHFQHDLDKLGHGLPNMGWDDVRAMARDGLDFGSHTVNHANLARIPLEQVERELVESRETLRRELDQSEFLFAYPFGRQDDITEDARRLVMEQGYLCCCSAYGGRNRGALALDNVLRIPINYNISMPALRARIDGWGASRSLTYSA